MAEATECQPPKKAKPEPRKRLNDLCDTIAKSASIDYNNTEIKDIQTALDTVLETIKTRVNERGVFKIARIQPGGSMVEKTSIWKYHWDSNGGVTASCNHNRPFIEFDYLALLKDPVEDIFDQKCPGCIKMSTNPVNLEQLEKLYRKEDGYTRETLKDKSVLNELFWHEINKCLISSCDCLAFNDDHTKWKFNRQLAFQRKSETGITSCDKCSVTTSSGTLGVAILPNNQWFPNFEDCSLLFQWTSQAKSIFAPHKLFLQPPQQLSSLLVYVDFLPALEYCTETPSDEETSDNENLSEEIDLEHVYFIVPKQCNVCVFANRTKMKNYESAGQGWRKSWCKTELNEFVNEMSDKHKRCYQILKYIHSLASEEHINNYHMKIAVLRHNGSCTDSTEQCAECVLKLFQQLRKAYESKKLISPYSNQNLLRHDGYYDVQTRFCEMRINDLNFVTDTDTWETFISKCWLKVFSLSP